MRNLLTGFLIGVLVLGVVRFSFAPQAHPVHYHANFAIFVDGQRLDLSGDRYMEDVAACAAEDEILPRQRVHLHNNDQDVVHVHHGGVTWGHLLTNLGFGLGNNYLMTDDGRFLVDGEDGALTFIVNGFVVSSLHDRMIRRGDRALISFGGRPSDEILAEEFPQVASNAPQFDLLYDPAGCSGGHSPGLLDRLRTAFFW
jgi:hypothetical protein